MGNRVMWCRWPSVVALMLMALAGTAAACSDGDDPEAGARATGQTDVETTVEEEPAAPSASGTEAEIDADAAPSQPADSIEALEKHWAQARAEGVEAIRDSGLSPDVAGCPADWDDTDGVDGATITVAMTLAQTGQLSQYADHGRGFELYVDHINSSGGIAGRRLDLQLENDRFVAEITAELVLDLMTSRPVFGISTVGFPGTAEVRGFLNEQCVPQVLPISNHPAWGDPADHPWTTGYQLSFSTEALLWGAWIEQNLTDDLPVTVAALVSDDDLGVIYEQAFRAWADAHPDVVAEFVTVSHPSGAASVTSEMGQVAAAEPDVVLAMTQGQACVAAMADSAGLGLAESTTARFLPSVCRDPQAFVLPTGAPADGWWVVDGGFKPTGDPDYAEDVWVAWVNEQLEANGYATSNELYGVGFAHGWVHVEALRIAAELDGGLTRTNYLLALRSMSLPNPALVDGVAFEVDGTADAFFVEGSQFSQWDAAEGEWVERGDVIDVNGQTGTCSWDPGNGC